MVATVSRRKVIQHRFNRRKRLQHRSDIWLARTRGGFERLGDRAGELAGEVVLAGFSARLAPQRAGAPAGVADDRSLAGASRTCLPAGAAASRAGDFARAAASAAGAPFGNVLCASGIGRRIPDRFLAVHDFIALTKAAAAAFRSGFLARRAGSRTAARACGTFNRARGAAGLAVDLAAAPAGRAGFDEADDRRWGKAVGNGGAKAWIFAVAAGPVGEPARGARAGGGQLSVGLGGHGAGVRGRHDAAGKRAVSFRAPEIELDTKGLPGGDLDRAILAGLKHEMAAIEAGEGFDEIGNAGQQAKAGVARGFRGVGVRTQVNPQSPCAPGRAVLVGVASGPGRSSTFG